MDVNVQRRGIAMASMCLCCANPSLETIEHLFIKSDLACAVRKHFAGLLHRQNHVRSVEHWLHAWSNGVNIRSQMGYTITGAIFYSLWELWKHRCKLKFEGGTANPNAIINATLSHVRFMNGFMIPKRRETQFEKTMLQNLCITVRNVGFRRGKWVCWTRPDESTLKLNIDGSKRGNDTTAGGVCRNASGEFVFGFAMKLAHSDILRAELEAIWHGLQLCWEKQLINVALESDSELACNMIINREKVPWKYMYLVRRICNLLGPGYSLHHIYRQANKVADGFATIAHGTNASREFKELTEVPRNIQKLLFFDRIGFPAYRPNCI